MQRRSPVGFTLIELMIVVAIIGILAAIAIPNFVKFQCRSKQSEAKNNLKALFAAQESYRAEFDTYVEFGVLNQDAINDPNPVGFSPKGDRLRYNYICVPADRTTFRGNAFANDVDGLLSGDSNGGRRDEWEIHEDNDLRAIVNACE